MHRTALLQTNVKQLNVFTISKAIQLALVNPKYVMITIFALLMFATLLPVNAFSLQFTPVNAWYAKLMMIANLGELHRNFQATAEKLIAARKENADLVLHKINQNAKLLKIASIVFLLILVIKLNAFLEKMAQQIANILKLVAMMETNVLKINATLALENVFITSSTPNNATDVTLIPIVQIGERILHLLAKKLIAKTTFANLELLQQLQHVNQFLFVQTAILLSAPLPNVYLEIIINQFAYMKQRIAMMEISAPLINAM
jgi:hypothetical protein